jgi:acetyl-CoA synthetase|tara:strand:- start:8047 stop:9681 length:1635 start_codon:yes stop_codon:yes gene_type:complete
LKKDISFSYEKIRSSHDLKCPDNFNFGFDIISDKYGKSEKTALIAIQKSTKKVQKISYKELNENSSKFANALKNFGIKKKDNILVILPRIPEWYYCILGCSKVGAVAIPCTKMLKAKDIEYRAKKSNAKVIISTSESSSEINKIKDNCKSLKYKILVKDKKDDWYNYDEICKKSDVNFGRDMVPPTKSNDLMLIYFTSGSTAMPKMVERDQSYAFSHIITQKYWQDLKSTDIHWTLTDTGWAKAAWGLLYPPLLAGCTIILYDNDGFDLDEHLEIIKKHKVTTFCAPPTIYRLMAQSNLANFEVSSLRHCFSAGEPLNPEAMRSWKNATGCDVYDGYGQTETINIIANFPGMKIKKGSMGRPCPGFEIEIIDNQANILEINQIGNIGIKITDPYPPGLFRGYYQDQKKTSEVFKNGWYFTGDTATKDKDGYFWFVGRSDDIITSSGYRISPFEVESVLLEHPYIVEAAVVAKPDKVRGEIVAAFIVLGKNYNGNRKLKLEIQEFVKNNTAPYKYPREIIFTKNLPKTISGKIRRIDLRNKIIKI